jgi:MFS family permease
MRIIKSYPKLLFFGFITNVLSGLGQSFYLSLFTPLLIDRFQVSNSQFGVLFSTATLASGLVIPFIGKLLNHESPKGFIFFTYLGIAAFCMNFSMVESLPILWLTIFGLRFFGQGMLAHVSTTMMATRFSYSRGVALSMANLGFPVSEALLPIIAYWALTKYGFGPLWMGNAVVVLLILSLVPNLLKGSFEAHPDHWTESGPKLKEFRGLRSITFWYFALASILPAFLLTALFLYHGVILESRGLGLKILADHFVYFAFARFAASLVSGMLIDRFGSRTLYPGYLLPLTFGLLVLFYGESKYSFASYLMLCGLTQGAASTIMTSIWAEIYGHRRLSEVRSLISSFAIIGTAAGPFAFGLLIDSPLGVNGALGVLTFLQAGIFLATVIIRPWVIKKE